MRYGPLGIWAWSRFAVSGFDDRKGLPRVQRRYTRQPVRKSRPIVTFRLAAQHALPVANLTNDQVLRMLGQASRVPRIWKTKRSGELVTGINPGGVDRSAMWMDLTSIRAIGSVSSTGVSRRGTGRGFRLTG